MNGIINRLGSSGISFSSLELVGGANVSSGDQYIVLGTDKTANYEVVLGLSLGGYKLVERHRWVGASQTDTIIDQKSSGSIPGTHPNLRFSLYTVLIGYTAPFTEAVVANALSSSGKAIYFGAILL
ncbi:MAG TPA: hypothetical protein DCW90_08600 [Lachnospiraceae bacterium]|nr:hypothetical protein [Lachnospiraceae bacterium]